MKINERDWKSLKDIIIDIHFNQQRLDKSIKILFDFFERDIQSVNLPSGDTELIDFRNSLKSLLSNRTYNICSANLDKVVTVGYLVDLLDKKKIYRWRNCGLVTSKEIIGVFHNILNSLSEKQ